MRIGIGHPGVKDQVIGSVLGRPSGPDREAIETAIDAALEVLPLVLDGDMAKAMNLLHRRQPPNTATS
jgi:PTH1 family peptidyl-tRNA hydrolase